MASPVWAALLDGGHPHHLALVVLGVLGVPPLVAAVHPGHGVEVVGGHRRRDRPFEAAGVPGVRARRGQMRGVALGLHDVPHEYQHPQRDQQRPPRWPPCSRTRIRSPGRRVSMRRDIPCRPRMCMGPKVRLNPTQHDPEVPVPQPLVEEVAPHLGPPEVQAGEQAEHPAPEDHIVEVGHDVVGVGLLGVGRGHRVGHAGQAADGEHGHRGHRELHGHREMQLPAPHGGQPV